MKGTDLGKKCDRPVDLTNGQINGSLEKNNSGEQHAPIQFPRPRCDSVLVEQRGKGSLGNAALICRHDFLVNALDKATLGSGDLSCTYLKEKPTFGNR